MTAVDQDAAIERSVTELARRLRMVVPPSMLADPVAFALAFKRWELGEHWRCIPPPPPVITATRAGTPPTEEFKTRKAAISRKDDQP